MPELPEVHTTATILNELLPGLTIKDVWSGYNSVFHKNKPNIKNTEYFAVFKKEIVGAKVKSVARRGKNVLIHLSNGKTILVHMKMTGHLLYGKYRKVIYKDQFSIFKPEEWEAAEEGPLKDPFNRFIRLVFTLSNGRHLAFSDMRKFAKVCVLETAKLGESSDLAHLGPEPLEQTFIFPVFREQLMKRPNGKIKQVLMDQSLIAGVGNIYSDEALWLSAIHPLSKTGELPEKKLKDLYAAAKTVLKKGIDFSGDSTSDYRNPYGERGQFQHKHNAYRATGKKCPKRGCGGIIKRLKIGGRSAHYCDRHQKRY